MSRDWDIVGNERVFSTRDDIMRPIVRSSRPKAEISSMASIAIFIGMTAASGIRAETPVVMDPLGGTSDLCIILERASVPLKKAPEREKNAGVDFARGRSTKQLAHSFTAFFGPAKDIDDSSDEGYVFR